MKEAEHTVLRLCHQASLAWLTPIPLSVGLYPEASLVPHANEFLS